MHNILLLPTHSHVPHRFLQLSPNVTVHGYQLYAVEKWLVDRARHISLLVVYTGDNTHSISLSPLAPAPDLEPHLAQSAWDAAIALLRADGAKPKQTPHGVLMVTSLAHFRSDYTIVQIPAGNFLAAKDQLYVNINLLRMGCSGRTALTLEDPSDTTKERFISTYGLPETTISHSLPLPTSRESLPLQTPALTPSSSLHPPSSPQRHNPRNPQIGLGRPSNSWRSPDRPPTHSTSSLPSRKDKETVLHGKTKERSAFLVTVLELVKLIQAGLAIFGMYGITPSSHFPPPNLVLDGLLCDQTVDGIRNWISAVGGPCVGLEPTERIVDPSFISGLLSLVITIRNKLAFLGHSHIIPRDPFLHPYAFCVSLAAYTQSSSSALPAPSSSSHLVAPPASQHFHTLSPYPAIFPMAHVSSIPLIPAAPPITNPLSAAAAANAAIFTPSASTSTLAMGTVLTRDLVESITTAYEAKNKVENSRVRRVIKNRLAPGGADSDGAGATDGDREREKKNSLSLTATDSAMEKLSSHSHSHGHVHSLSLSANSPNGSTGQSGGIGSSGGQIFSGIGSFASGLGLGAAGSGPGSGNGGHLDASSLVTPTIDLLSFVGSLGVHGDSGKRERKRKSRERRRESVDIGIGYAYVHGHKEREKELREGVVGGSVKALWSGRVADIVRMREWELEGHLAGNFSHKEKSKKGLFEARSIASDDGEDETGLRSTEDESDVLGSGPGEGSVGRGSFGSMWGGRVRGKLGSWAGLARRKHQSVDLSATSSLNSSSRVPGVVSAQTSPRSPPQITKLPKLIIGNSHGSNSLTATPPSSIGRRPPITRRSTTGGSRAQSPTLPPMIFSLDGNRDPDDDDLLSSGQVSPLSDYRPNPFQLSRNNDSISTSNVNLDEHTLAKLLQNPKRPFAIRRLSQTARISSWADPVSARDLDGPDDKGELDDGALGVSRPDKRLSRESNDLIEEDSDASELKSHASGELIGPKWKRKEKARFHSLLSVVDGEGVLLEEPLGDSDEEDVTSSDDEDIHSTREWHERKRKANALCLKRRRSFHDMDSFRECDVLTVERMRIDVELCGQMLIMTRREQHLRNVVACAGIIARSLALSKDMLHDHYRTHLDDLEKVKERASILTEMENENIKTDSFLQTTNTLRYESEQFNVSDLWQAASPSRRKVFALRDKVFSTGGRRLPAGVNGAHGAFNRLQWTIPGQTRLVDFLGRTESEAEEERRIDPVGTFIGGPPEEGEEDVVEHPGIKPMWLLRFFTSWGARWSAAPTVSAGVIPDAFEPSHLTKDQGVDQDVKEAKYRGSAPLYRSTLSDSPSAVPLPPSMLGSSGSSSDSLVSCVSSLKDSRT